MLKTLLDGKTCAECRNCCVFLEKSVWETPRMTGLHKQLALDLNLPARFIDKGSHCYMNYDYSSGNRLAACAFLDMNSGCTLTEEQKPFDCKLWPVRVMMCGDEVYITLYRNCPAFSDDKKLRQLDELLDESLAKIIKNEAEKNPDIIKPYSDGYEKLRKL